jgi:hypothetical protein
MLARFENATLLPPPELAEARDVLADAKGAYKLITARPSTLASRQRGKQRGKQNR